MAQDRVVHTKYRHKPGFFERLGSSFLGSGIGTVLFFAAFIVLYMNESRSVRTETLLDEGRRIVVPVHDGIRMEETDQRLVHVTGPLQADVLADPKYPVAIPCVRLSRKVEMYQWVEHSEVKEYDDGGEIRSETTYTYSTEWSPVLHQSRHFAEEFGHRNPSDISISTLHQVANRVSVSGFDLSTSAINKITWLQEMTRLSEPPPQMNLKLLDKYYYHCKDPLTPEVGDVRVFFEYAGIAGKSGIGQEEQVTIVAMNSRGRLVPYQMPSGERIEFLHRGVKSAREVFESEKNANTALTWLLRFVGWLMMFIGLNLITGVVRTLVDWIPIIRNIVSASVLMFNLSLSLFLSLITIAIGWFWARPLLSTAIAAASFIPWYFARRKAQTMHAYYSR